MGNNHRGKEPDLSIHVRGIGEKEPTQATVVPRGNNKALQSSNKVTRNLSFTMELLALSEKAKQTKSIDDLRGLFKHYLEMCNEYSIVPNNISAYQSIGITTQTAKMWAAGKAGAEKKELIDFVNQFLASTTQIGILTGTISPTIGIFLQKNFDGLSDQPVAVAEENDLLGEKPSADDIIERYSDLPDED